MPWCHKDLHLHLFRIHFHGQARPAVSPWTIEDDRQPHHPQSGISPSASSATMLHVSDTWLCFPLFGTGLDRLGHPPDSMLQMWSNSSLGDAWGTSGPPDCPPLLPPSPARLRSSREKPMMAAISAATARMTRLGSSSRLSRENLHVLGVNPPAPSGLQADLAAHQS